MNRDSLSFLDTTKGDCAIILIQIDKKFIFAFIGNGKAIENALSTMLIENDRLKEIFIKAATKYILNNN